SMMDERTEMRIHVGDNARTLRGVEQVGGWFLRADKGLKMIPGDVRDLGNTYQADLVVVRPGAPSQHLDAQFRVDAGKITSINPPPSSRWPRPPGAGPRGWPRPSTGVPGASAYDGEAFASGTGTGIVIWSPIVILFGFLICLLAASSCWTVTWKRR